jgi:hypothetical protein
MSYLSLSAIVYWISILMVVSSLVVILWLPGDCSLVGKGTYYSISAIACTEHGERTHTLSIGEEGENDLGRKKAAHTETPL